jgi:hypothetical protein
VPSCLQSVTTNARSWRLPLHTSHSTCDLDQLTRNYCLLLSVVTSHSWMRKYCGVRSTRYLVVMINLLFASLLNVHTSDLGTDDRVPTTNTALEFTYSLVSYIRIYDNLRALFGLAEIRFKPSSCLILDNFHAQNVPRVFVDRGFCLNLRLQLTE